MFYVKNLPGWERGLRVGGGAIMAAYGLLSLSGSPAWLLAAAGVGTALSGMLGFCPMCALAGRRLAKRARS
jgi:hypothetical protein